MMTTELRFHVPEDILYTLNETKQQFIGLLRFYAAIELFKLHKLSLGKASELAAMNKIDFMLELGRHGIPVIDYDEEDFRNEIERIVKI